MAAHGAPEYSVAEGNDYAAHEQTYDNFITMIKWGSGSVILLVAGMAYFLT
ncbi:MAG: aa3-type cytochrome c oxidase subunit IV [Alphaproteobacteria bacterium]|nr:aa3-type cytochrome c oxidase subunit IV [Alphaproteobacteria bacterium]